VEKRKIHTKGFNVEDILLAAMPLKGLYDSVLPVTVLRRSF
jgi:hypothetical protein